MPEPSYLRATRIAYDTVAYDTVAYDTVAYDTVAVDYAERLHTELAAKIREYRPGPRVPPRDRGRP